MTRCTLATYLALNLHVFMRRSRLEYAHAQPCGHGQAEFTTQRKLLLRDRLLCKNLFGRLGMGADNQRWLHFFKPPTSGNARSLARCVITVRTCANHLGIWTCFNTSQDWIVAPIVKILHHTGNRGKVFRCAKYVSIGLQKVVGPGLIGGLENGRSFSPCGRSSSFGHLTAAARPRMINNKKFHHLLSFYRLAQRLRQPEFFNGIG